MALREQKANGFQRIITGDESWFFFCHPRDLVWAASRDELSQSIKQKIDTKRCLVSTFWSVNGIHGLLGVLKGTTYNTAFAIDPVLPYMVENVRARICRKTLAGWLIHMGNACPHNSRQAQS
jgi:hypothetical protein